MFSQEKEKLHNERADMTIKIAELLIEAGCRPTYKTDLRQTAITLAIMQVNVVQHIKLI